MRIATFTSRLPTVLSAEDCTVVLPPTQHVVLDRDGTNWCIEYLKGGLMLGGGANCKVFIGRLQRLLPSPCLLSNYSQVVLENVQELNSTPSGLGDSVTITRTSSLQIRNTFFLDVDGGHVFVPIFIANSTGYLYTESTQVTFLGETWNKTTVKCRTSPLSLVFETNKKFFGAGMVSGDYPIVLAGKNGESLTPNEWAVVEAAPTGGIIKSFAPAGTTWILANFKMWDEEEPPAFAKVISDESSAEIYRFVLPPAQQKRLLFKFTAKARQKVRAFRYRSTATIPTSVEDAGVTVLQLPATMGEWQWVGYPTLSHQVTFNFGANGFVDIDIETLKNTYFNNYDRVYAIFSSLQAFENISFDFSQLPTKEGYIVYLNGGLPQLQSTMSKAQYIARTLQRENINIVLKLSPNCIPVQFIQKAMTEIAGGLTPITVWQDGNTLWITLLCAVSSSETLTLTYLHAIKESIKNTFTALVDNWEDITIKVIALPHRV